MQMNRSLRAGLALLPVMLAALLVVGHAPTQSTPPPAAPPGLEKIQHFVFIMQENRSFDHYFGTYPGAEGLPPGVCVPNPAGGPCVAPYHDAALVNQGGAHNWVNALNCIDGGLMDGFIAGSTSKARRCDGMARLARACQLLELRAAVCAAGPPLRIHHFL